MNNKLQVNPLFLVPKTQDEVNAFIESFPEKDRGMVVTAMMVANNWLAVQLGGDK
jgi:hypothetical protein